MKPKPPVCFFSVLLLCSCDGNRFGDQYRSVSPAFDRKPVSKIEKAWIARHQYDHERRLLIPKLGGARWGAVQEYKEDGTIEFKDWWERDAKIEDLEAVPSTVLSAPRAQEGKDILPQDWGFDRQTVPSQDLTPRLCPKPFLRRVCPSPPESLRSPVIRLSPQCLLRMIFSLGCRNSSCHRLNPIRPNQALLLLLRSLDRFRENSPNSLRPVTCPRRVTPVACLRPVHCLIPRDFRPWKKVKSRKATHFPSFPRTPSRNCPSSLLWEQVRLPLNRGLVSVFEELVGLGCKKRGRFVFVFA